MSLRLIRTTLRSVALLLLVTGLMQTPTAPAASTGGADRPYLGWSSWSALRCDVNDQVLRGQALAVIDSSSRTAPATSTLTRLARIRSTASGARSTTRRSFRTASPRSCVRPDSVSKIGVVHHARDPDPGLADAPIAGTPFTPATSSTRRRRAPGNDLCQYGDTFEITCRIDYSLPGAQRYIDSSAALFASSASTSSSSTPCRPVDQTSYDTGPTCAWSTALAATGRPIQLILPGAWT